MSDSPLDKIKQCLAEGERLEAAASPNGLDARDKQDSWLATKKGI